MKTKLILTSIAGSVGLGLWSLDKAARKQELENERRLLNPRSIADCSQTELVLSGLLGVNERSHLSQACKRRLDEQSESLTQGGSVSLKN